MLRYWFAIASLALLAAMGPAAAAGRPNVLVVLTDDMRWDAMGVVQKEQGKPDRHASELYDLRADPLEVKNLAADPAHAAKVKEMAGLLERLLKEHGALPDTMPLDEGIKNVLPKF